jgi:hypothetical protein
MPPHSFSIPRNEENTLSGIGKNPGTRLLLLLPSKFG